jgi:MFS family permease
LLVLANFVTPLSTMPSTAEALHAGPAAQTWLISSISVGLAAALLAAGAVADDYGRRRVFVAGSGLLAVAAIGCAASTSPLLFVLGRVAQGVGSAAVVSSSLGLIANAFPTGAARARATGIWGACVGGGIAVGPILAAGLSNVSGWRTSYWVIAGAALAIAVAGQVLLRESRADLPRRVDALGVILLGGSLTCLLAGLVEGRDGWARPAVGTLLGAGIALAAAFAVAERRARAPMLDPGLFRRRPFVAATLGALTTGLGVLGLMSYLPTVLQVGLHRSPLMTAVALLAWSGTSVVTALAARRLPAAISPHAQMVGSLLIVAVGLAALGDLNTGSEIARLLPGLLVAGAGSGVLNAALGRQAVASVPIGRAGMGSGANNTARYVGAAIGVAIVIAVIAAHTGAPHTGATAMVDGWNSAALVAAALSGAGALAVAACRTRPD